MDNNDIVEPASGTEGERELDPRLQREVPPEEETEDVCYVCQSPMSRWPRPPPNNDFLSPEDGAAHMTEYSRNLQPRVMRSPYKLCSNCSLELKNFSKFQGVVSKAKKNLLCLWKRGRNRAKMNGRLIFIKSEPTDNDWDEFGNTSNPVTIEFEIALKSILDGSLIPGEVLPRQIEDRDINYAAEEIVQTSDSNGNSGASCHMEDDLQEADVLVLKCWKCKVCERVFDDRSSVCRHVKEIHMSAGSNTCSGARLKIKNEGDRRNYNGLPRHQYQNKYFEVEEEEDDHRPLPRGIICLICNKICSSKFELLKHLLFVDKSHMCGFCNYAFGTVEELKEHEILHKKIRDAMQCSSCPSRFTDHFFFTAHIKRCRGISWGMSQCYTPGYVGCKLCKKVNIPYNEISQHMLEHRGTCRFCGKNFEISHGLKVHAFSIHGSGHFACSVCPDLLTDPKSLELHIDAHSKGDIPPMFYNMAVSIKSEPKNKEINDTHKTIKPMRSLKLKTEDSEPNNASLRTDENEKIDIKLKVLNCYFCEFSFISTGSLLEHFFTFHNDEIRQKIKRGVGNNFGKYSDIFTHIKNLQDSSLRSPLSFASTLAHCEYCTSTFKTEKGLNIHKGRMHGHLLIRRDRSRSPIIHIKEENVRMDQECENRIRNQFPGGSGESRRNIVPGRNESDMKATIQRYLDQADRLDPKREVFNCWKCDRCFGTSKGLALHAAWHKRKENLDANSNIPRNESGVPDKSGVPEKEGVPAVKVEQTRTQQTRTQTTRNVPLKKVKKEDAVWNCNRCKLQLPSMTLFDQHQDMHLRAEATNVGTKESDEMKVHRVAGMSCYQCVLCHDKFFDMRQFKGHLLLHDGCGAISRGGFFNCQHCEVRFKCLKAFLTHIKTHDMKAKSAPSDD